MEFLAMLWKRYLVNILDILIVAYITYKLFMLLKGTRAIQVLRGLFILILATLVARALEFKTVSWILKGFWVAGVIAIVIVFQPELRSVLARIGRGPVLKSFFSEKLVFIDEIIKALERLSKKGFGALIVLEQNTGLRNYVESGVIINGEVTADLLCSIFMSRAPIHDGAAIVQNDRLIAAGCVLPLTHEPGVSKILGTRHRAAIGITEVSDAWAIVVSEETGDISLARNRKLERKIDIKELQSEITQLYKAKLEEAKEQFIQI
ncbi:TIGR00159 family protein [bacterium]|nr:TIGR00159 family protein [bacterium]NIN92325.1 TIGR00159 family protein [bacterium]NIO18447.1 TIGR00159 family protein [bacterium]NIO73440.1 TIGR00159 family protein [bacterium]